MCMLFISFIPVFSQTSDRPTWILYAVIALFLARLGHPTECGLEKFKFVTVLLDGSSPIRDGSSDIRYVFKATVG